MEFSEVRGTFIGPVMKEDETSAEQARKKAESNARMTRLFTGLTLLVGLFVLGAVGYAIYLQPSNPQPLGTATVEITGDSKVAFSGTVGVVNDERRIEGTAPTRLEVPYEEADDVAAGIEQQA